MDKPTNIDELRADFVSLLWAYLEGTNGAYIEWPPRMSECQSTPITSDHEQTFLCEIIQHAMTLGARLEEVSEQAG